MGKIRMDELSEKWIDGWQTACQKIKSIVSDSTLKINDAPSRLVVDEIFNQIAALEKRGFSEMPTLIVQNRGQQETSQ